MPFEKIKIEYKPQNDKDSLIIVDPSTNPPTPVQYFKLLLQDAGAGTPQNPLGPFPLASTIAIDDPNPAGLGDAAKSHISELAQPSGSNEVPQESFVVIRTQINDDPGTGQPTAMKKGTVKFFNESKGFGFVVSGQGPGQPEFDYLLRGDIDPTQTALTFAGPPDIQGGGPTLNSFFDIFVELHFDGSAAPTNPNAPLFSLTLTQAQNPQPASLLPSPSPHCWPCTTRKNNSPLVCSAFCTKSGRWSLWVQPPPKGLAQNLPNLHEVLARLCPVVNKPPKDGPVSFRIFKERSEYWGKTNGRERKPIFLAGSFGRLRKTTD